MDEPLETIDETMETSSSQAFSDFQRRRAPGSTRVTRSQFAEGFQTPMQGDTPLHATIRSIAEEVASQADRRAAAINPSINLLLPKTMPILSDICKFQNICLRRSVFSISLKSRNSDLSIGDQDHQF